MRSLGRNKRVVHYALFVEDIENVDEYGNKTGEFTPVYSDPVELRCNVSAATGEDIAEAFGNITEYSRILCVTDVSCPIDEKSAIWFGIPASEPHNYIVVRKADSKNGILYAIQEVTVT